MSMASGWILMSGLILGGAGLVRGQGLPSGQPPAVPSKQPQTHAAEVEAAREQFLKEASPELAAFQERLKKLDAEMDKIMESFVNKEIDKDAAKEQLLPLVTEEQEIQSDPDYLVEEKLVPAYLASPKYAAKLNEIFHKYNAKRRSNAKAPQHSR